MYHWLLFNVIHVASSDIMKSKPVRGRARCKVTKLRLARYPAYSIYNEVKRLPHSYKRLQLGIYNSYRYRSCPTVNARFALQSI